MSFQISKPCKHKLEIEVTLVYNRRIYKILTHVLWSFRTIVRVQNEDGFVSRKILEFVLLLQLKFDIICAHL